MTEAPASVAGACCFWLASRAEDALNIAKFGKAYEEYGSKVSVRNVVEGLKRLRRS